MKRGRPMLMLMGSRSEVDRSGACTGCAAPLKERRAKKKVFGRDGGYSTHASLLPPLIHVLPISQVTPGKLRIANEPGTVRNSVSFLCPDVLRCIAEEKEPRNLYKKCAEGCTNSNLTYTLSQRPKPGFVFCVIVQTGAGFSSATLLGTMTSNKAKVHCCILENLLFRKGQPAAYSLAVSLFFGDFIKNPNIL